MRILITGASGLLGLNLALEEIRRNRGIGYDSTIVDICVNLFTARGFKWNHLESHLRQ